MSTVTKVDALYTVETPEGVDFQFRIAGPGRRALAFAIDMSLKISVVVAAVIGLSFFAMLPDSFGNAALGLLFILGFVLNWLYSGLFEGLMGGQTPGKWFLNLRVVRSNGTPIEFISAFGRGLLLAADIVPGVFLVGTLSMLCTRKMQRLGDLVCDTIVIHEKKEHVELTLRRMSNVPAIRKSECTGRFHVPERTLSLIETLFDSRRYISGGRRDELAKILAVQISRLMGYPIPVSRQDYYVNTLSQDYYGDYALFLRRVLATFSSRHTAAPENGSPFGIQQQPGYQGSGYAPPGYAPPGYAPPNDAGYPQQGYPQHREPEITYFPGVQTDEAQPAPLPHPTLNPGDNPAQAQPTYNPAPDPSQYFKQRSAPNANMPQDSAPHVSTPDNLAPKAVTPPIEAPREDSPPGADPDAEEPQ